MARVIIATLYGLAGVGIIGCALFIAYHLGQVKVRLDNMVNILADRKIAR